MNIKSRSKMFFIISGIIYCLAGLLIIFYPLATIATMAIFLGCGILASGISYLISYFSDREIVKQSAWVLFVAITDIIIGIFLIANIGGTMMAVPFIVGFWALFVSVSRVAAAFSLQALGIKRWWWTLIVGILGIILAMIIMFCPVAGALLIAIYVGVFMLMMGLFSIAEALYIK